LSETRGRSACAALTLLAALLLSFPKIAKDSVLVASAIPAVTIGVKEIDGNGEKG